MLPPEQDLRDRQDIWDAMQMFFMDTDTAIFAEGIARTCAASKYSLEELEDILFQEVLPACRFNLLMLPAPEWTGFTLEYLTEQVLEKHRFGKRRPFMFRNFTQEYWGEVRGRILELRGENVESPPR